MAVKGPAVLAALIIVGLVVGGGVGYFARAGEVSTLGSSVAKAIESKGMIEAELKGAKANLTKAIESKGMLQAELDKAKADLAKAKESKGMLEAELRARVLPIPFVPEKGQMIHDVWLFITQLGEGKFAVVIRAEGLEATKGEGAYLVEGVTRTEPMRMIPIGPTVAASEFLADTNGNGLYWIVVDKDPRTLFDKILILFLPGMSMERAVLLAAAKLG